MNKDPITFKQGLPYCMNTTCGHNCAQRITRAVMDKAILEGRRVHTQKVCTQVAYPPPQTEKGTYTDESEGN